MALGVNDRTNGNQRTEFHPTTFSKIAFSNKDGEVDKSRISFSIWNGMLKVNIAPFILGSENNYDNKNAIALHLSVPKAYIFLKEIERFQQDKAQGITDTFFYGVNTAKGLIGICTGQEYGFPNKTCIVIMRVDETGNVLSTYAYELKDSSFYSAVRNFKADTKEFDKFNYEDVELELIKKQLYQYINGMTMGQGSAVVDALSYNSNAVYTSLNQIKSKLGIPVGGANRSMGANEFFNSSNTNAPKAAYDTISEAIGDSGIDAEDIPF